MCRFEKHVVILKIKSDEDKKRKNKKPDTINHKFSVLVGFVCYTCCQQKKRKYIRFTHMQMCSWTNVTSSDVERTERKKQTKSKKLWWVQFI